MHLYIDTHYEKAVVALLSDGKLIEKLEVISNKHSENVVDMIDSLLKKNNITVDDLKGVIVINGPGSFTGVRIGVVIAKVLAFAKNIEVKSITYLCAMAINSNTDGFIGLEDKNGVFCGKFKNKNLIGDYFYLTNKERENFLDDIALNISVDIEKVYEYLKDKDSVNPHFLKPLYVKRIEVDKC